MCGVRDCLRRKMHFSSMTKGKRVYNGQTNSVTIYLFRVGRETRNLNYLRNQHDHRQ